MESGVDATGMSSETIIFTARWQQGGQRLSRSWWPGCAPPRTCRVSVIPAGHQFDVVRKSASSPTFGAPGALARATGDVLGTPFL
ncbi:hypothetical protein I553_0083 [Mycobacterium xenopi 4042]|uniref:Uncharacterized protein n=1 Tax=Mycobacterium xenopi 4042 TaxID=1299334 RepID=X7YJ71_MYCXE|nr:hypothetical protein I553_0083 [Mycobacterium xenopi 4042]